MKTKPAQGMRWFAQIDRMAITWIAALGLAFACRTTAQTFTTLHYFTTDGFSPESLVLSSNTLYGTTSIDFVPDILDMGNGTVFKLNADGSNFATVHAFGGGVGGGHGLALSGTTMYGVTMALGGASRYGALFECNTDGTAFTNLFNFPAGTNGLHPSDAAHPFPNLVLMGTTLFGTTFGPFEAWAGAVFRIDTDGTGFAILHDFAATNTNSSGVYTNCDGVRPSGGLILSGETLYGTASGGGSAGSGTVFRLKSDGTGFTVLHSFTAVRTNESGVYTNTDGAHPRSGLILSGSTLHGAASDGGSSGSGTLFKVNTDGTGFVNLHSFTTLVPALSNYNYFGAVITYTNSDGAHPGGLVFSNDTLYGAASSGGSSGSGTIFAVNTSDGAFMTLYSFTALSPAHTNQSIVSPIRGVLYTNSDGAFPQGLILAGHTLYGTTGAGGTNGIVWFDGADSFGFGTLFSLSFRPQLAIALSGTNVILTWPATCAGFDYSKYRPQVTADLGLAGWTTVDLPSPPAIVSNQCVVAIPNTATTRRFYRLSQ